MPNVYNFIFFHFSQKKNARLSRTQKLKFKDFQGVQFGEINFQDFQGCMGTMLTVCYFEKK